MIRSIRLDYDFTELTYEATSFEIHRCSRDQGLFGQHLSLVEEHTVKPGLVHDSKTKVCHRDIDLVVTIFRWSRNRNVDVKVSIKARRRCDVFKFEVLGELAVALGLVFCPSL